MEGQTTGNSPLFATVHRPFKVDAEKGRRVRLKGKKERRQKARNGKKKLTNASPKSNVKAYREYHAKRDKRKRHIYAS